MSKKENKLYVTDTDIKNYKDSNYLKEIDKVLKGTNYTPGIHHIKIAHDSWCNIYKQKACNCNPEVSKLCV